MPWWGWLALWIAVSVIFGLGYVTGAIMAKGAQEDEVRDNVFVNVPPAEYPGPPRPPRQA